MDNTRDLSKFGQIEREEAGKLLLALGTDKDKTRFLGQDVAVEFNANSGNVFLVDGDFNVAMLTDEGNLEDFFSCPICGAEGFLDEVKKISNHSGSDIKECKDYIKQIKD